MTAQHVLPGVSLRHHLVSFPPAPFTLSPPFAHRVVSAMADIDSEIAPLDNTVRLPFFFPC